MQSDPLVDSDTNNPASDALDEFVSLEQERRELETRLKEIKRRTAQLSDAILEDWASRGVQNTKVHGLTVYVANDFQCWKARGVSTEQVCSALERHGLGMLVNPAYPPSSLKSWVKERVDQEEPIPKDLDDLLSYDTVPRIKTRKS